MIPALLLAAHVHRMQYVMGTLCEITAYAPTTEAADAAVTAAFAELTRYDRALSLFKPQSPASRLNQAGTRPFACTAELFEALEASARYSAESGGAFDATILPVLREGSSALARIGYRKIGLDAVAKTARFSVPGMAIDFGGIGKGLALDHAAAALRERDVRSALINFGGQLYALGAPPDGDAWAVTVEGSTRTLRVKDASVSSSGNSQQPGHIASPFTGERLLGRPAVTVVARSATEADAWSTALFVQGASSATYRGCYLFENGAPSAACAPYL